MKISIITVVYNAAAFLEDCIRSVIAQDYPDIEYIVIDGGSTDGSLAIIEKYGSHIHHFVSEKDKGMYDALNKGISMSSGEIIGILNADDMLASPAVISAVAGCFNIEKTDAVYGNLNYIHPETGKIIRKWLSKPYKYKNIAWGWMPAHPTLYIKKEIFEQFGNYSLDFGSAADYEMMLRLLYTHRIHAVFLDILMVNMRTGGMSNATLKHRYEALKNDYKALLINGLPFAIFTLLIKKIRKIGQYF